ncbi:VanZ family protein [Pleurocapsa sp. PCC 7319]|uniref:VanZ family protein n=1 Tax=Pleurocapsa sp. PCC 7319 TaxID=118161 RepID=UPI0008FC0E66
MLLKLKHQVEILARSNMINKLLTIIRRFWISITLFILSFITIMSLWPLEQLPPVPGNDKTHHLIAYAVLMFPTALRKPNYWPAIALFFICWSGGIELLQPYVNRYGEFHDLVANATGLICGLLMVKLIRWLFPVTSELK